MRQKNGERKALTEAKRYRDVIEGQIELISRFTPDGRYIFVNDAFCRYYQISWDQIIGSHFNPAIPPEDSQRIKEHFETLTPQKPSGFIEHRVIMPDGLTRWLHWSNLAFFNENGNIIEYQSVGRDITEKKETEISLIENLNYVNTLMHSIPVPVFYRDIYGIYQDCNRSFENLLGMRRDQIIGKKIQDLFPSDLAEHYRYMDDLIIKQPYIQQYEHQITNEKGEKIGVIFSKSALFSADGNIKGIIGVIFDISEKKILEQIIQKSEEKYRTIAEFTYDWEAWINPEGEYLYVSPSCKEITGYSPDDFINNPDLVIAITHPEDRALLKEHYSNMEAEKGKILQIDYRIIMKSGQERWINHFCQSVFRDDGTWIGRRESRRDITSRKQIEKAHEQANLKLNLLSNITRHDILNQLSGLIGYADMALESSQEPEIRDMLKRVLTAAYTITDQISFTRVYQEIGLHAPIWQHIPTLIKHVSSGTSLKVSVATNLERIEINGDPLIEKVFFLFA